MKLIDRSTQTLNEIAARMGNDATTEQARAMLAILEREKIEDTDDVPDSHWFAWVAEAINA